MIAPWLVYASAIGCLMVLVALLLERVARWRNWPTRWVWLAAVVAIVGLPIVLNLLGKAPVAAHRGTFMALGPIPARSHSLDVPLLALWLFSSLFLGTRLVGTAVALRRRRKVWERAVVDGKPVLLAHELGPAVIGWTKLTTVIPRWALALDTRSRALMLQHEEEHAQAGDPYLRTAAMIGLVAMPWNPAIWWSMRRLRLAVEIDCDRRLIASGVDPHVYASLLLTVGERIATTPFAWATALAGPRSVLEKRIIAMTSPFRPNRPRLAAVAVIAGVGAIVVVACQAPVPDPVLPPASVTTFAMWDTLRYIGPGRPNEIVVDTIEGGCSEDSDCGSDTLTHYTVQFRRRGPRDTVMLSDKLISPADTFESACEIHSDCHGYVGDARRNDTLFIYRKGGKILQNKLPAARRIEETSRTNEPAWSPDTGRHNDTLIVYRDGREQPYLKSAPPRGDFIPIRSR